MNGPLLSLRDLSITYRLRKGDVPAVRGVELDVAPGQVLGLAGESGCGKSTIGNAILRLLPDTTEVTGQILLQGEDVLTMKGKALRAVRWGRASIVFQGAMHSLDPVKRIDDQIIEAIRAHDTTTTAKAAATRVGDLLERVRLPGHRGQDYPHQLSGGQKQRVMIAMALACDPALVIADEPTTALDVMVQAQVLDLLRELQRDLGLGVLFITHDLSVLVEICDRIAVMYAGKIVEEGDADTVFTHPQHPYTKALGAAFPRIGDPADRYTPAGLDGDPPLPQEIPTGCSFHPRCPVAEDRCAVQEPSLVRTAAGGTAACLLVEPAGDTQGGGWT